MSDNFYQGSIVCHSALPPTARAFCCADIP